MTEDQEDMIENLHIEILKAIQQNNMISANEIIAHSKIAHIPFINYQIDFAPIHAAVWYGNQRMLLLLISEGADVNQISAKKMDCLTLATFRNNIQLVQILISLVVNPNYISRKGSALHIAANNDNAEIMKILLKHPKIDLNVKFQGQTPLKVAGQNTKRILEVQERAALSMSSISSSSNKSNITQIEQPAYSFGEIWKICRMGFCYKKRFISIDPIYGVLCVYQNKTYFPNFWNQVIPLESIKQISQKNNHWYVDKNYHFLTIKYDNKEIIFATQYNTTISLWEVSLNKAILFYQKNKKRKLSISNSNQIEIKDIELFNQQEHLIKQKMKIQQVYQPEQIIAQEKSEYESIKISDFQVIKCIGKGSFGYVFHIKYQNKDYALKQQEKKMLRESRNLDYALQEVQVISQLNHPFIVNFQVSFQTTKNLYILMDLLAKGDLAMYMTRGVKLEVQISKFLIAQIILAIEHLHQNNIIYRDLKPENVGLCGDGYIKIIDFGLAKALKSLDVTYTLCGSPAYLAPEVVLNLGITQKTDIYQIGLLLYEMITGYPPFYTTQINILMESIKTEIVNIPKEVPADLKDLLSRILKRDPNKRITIKEIKQHAFFKDLDWDTLFRKEYKTPELKQHFPQSRKAVGDLIDTDDCENDYIQGWNQYRN